MSRLHGEIDGKERAAGVVRRFLALLLHRLCSSPGKPRASYRRISASPSVAANSTNAVPPPASPPSGDPDDLVPLKVSLLGDSQTGKTSFMVKFVGDGEKQSGLQMSGLNLMDKMLSVKGARIVFSIWDVSPSRGVPQFVDHIPIACRDAAAIIVMFDLTRRCTLNNAMGWYKQARRWNKTGIPILIGTKFDDFVQLPPDLQLTVVNQARASARAMDATLFFSSAAHDINVSKVFKFITARFFSLPWTVERNLTLGEPTIDF